MRSKVGRGHLDEAACLFAKNGTAESLSPRKSKCMVGRNGRRVTKLVEGAKPESTDKTTLTDRITNIIAFFTFCMNDQPISISSSLRDHHLAYRTIVRLGHFSRTSCSRQSLA